jgi:hypothetical protein
MNHYAKRRKNRKVNSRITMRIIEFHQKGYQMDFLQVNDYALSCLQKEAVFPSEEVSVYLIDCCFNVLSRSFTYIHTVVTADGIKGLLLGDKIAFMLKRPVTND